MCQIDKTTDCQRRVCQYERWLIIAQVEISKRFDINVTTCIECQLDRREQKFFFSYSTTIICLRQNGIVSLSVAAAVAILALTAVKIPQGITRKRILFLLLSGSQRHHQKKKKERQWGYFIQLSFLCLYVQPFKYFACWWCLIIEWRCCCCCYNLFLYIKKWLTTIGDVSRSSNKCVRMCRVLSMRKYHDLSRTWSLEAPSSFSFHFRSIGFALSACIQSSCQFKNLDLLKVFVLSFLIFRCLFQIDGEK
jgi:hypothetical protein